MDSRYVICVVSSGCDCLLISVFISALVVRVLGLFSCIAVMSSSGSPLLFIVHHRTLGSAPGAGAWAGLPPVLVAGSPAGCPDGRCRSACAGVTPAPSSPAVCRRSRGPATRPSTCHWTTRDIRSPTGWLARSRACPYRPAPPLSGAISHLKPNSHLPAPVWPPMPSVSGAGTYNHLSPNCGVTLVSDSLTTYNRGAQQKVIPLTVHQERLCCHHAHMDHRHSEILSARRSGHSDHRVLPGLSVALRMVPQP